MAEQEQQFRADLAAVPAPLLNIDLTRIRQSWPGLTLDEQRDLIHRFVERVSVNRAVPGTKGFDSGRVAMEWSHR